MTRTPELETSGGGPGGERLSSKDTYFDVPNELSEYICGIWNNKK